MTPDEDAMCIGCLSTLPRLAASTMAATAVGSVLANAPAPAGFSAVWYSYSHTHPASQMIRTAKYGNRPRLARQLGMTFGRELMADYGGAMSSIDVLLPVPMHWWRRLRRGYNQSVEIARGLSQVSGIPVGDNMTSIAHHGPQASKSRNERLNSQSGSMVCYNPHELDDLDICLVDDVVTTGATLTECVMAIGRSGARPASIGVLALATGNS